MNYDALTEPIDSREFEEYKRENMSIWKKFVDILSMTNAGAQPELSQLRDDFRLLKFGEQNNLSINLKIKGNNGLSGSIFQVGHLKEIRSLLTAADGTWAVGDYAFLVPAVTDADRGFMMLQLPHRMPHMILDSKSNNYRIGLSNLPIKLPKDQRLALEGDFNTHFTLYAPREYKHDALYIFTPDLMALLIDTVAQYDIEIIGDKLFVYGGSFNLIDPALWQQLMKIKRVLERKLERPMERYVDEHSSANNENILKHSNSRGLERRRPITSYALFVIGIFFVILLIALAGIIGSLIDKN